MSSQKTGCPSIMNSTHNEAYWRAHEAAFSKELHSLPFKDCVFYHSLYLDATKGSKFPVNTSERDRFTDLWTTVKAIHCESAVNGKYISWEDFMNAVRFDWYDENIRAIRKTLYTALDIENYIESVESRPEAEATPLVDFDGNVILTGIPDLLKIPESEWIAFSRRAVEKLLEHPEYRQVFLSVISRNTTGCDCELADGRNMWTVMQKLDRVLKSRGIYITKQQFLDNIALSTHDVIRVNLVAFVVMNSAAK